ncbi:DEAD/DEAH box helicase [Paracidovorax citrulli]|uniref:DEAD/DEAH box helicase domain protein n=2 Tax=Paracidovorax citrulli TaxID=80869 RepID=A1TNE0_PARC0|nr:DEAD/DEAH box helicase [Paracidovorax citrulli]ABM32478.1 DEAD/DEAH box helicase domain protein [Paracidovorax citrulli AAC00-1]ATG93485.1 ATP-dependent helicase [Paracidovorax citrulli]PVY66694.1 superfamily II DNA/RNA helicase [Paracidovorax citrulli]REG69139.1 superfamily II DNA/RNA helicase [Paracidovorax citrulli]RLJ93694.1 superfamily II DNA/RNA helicase [Paracidovorax citrulli]
MTDTLQVQGAFAPADSSSVAATEAAVAPEALATDTAADAAAPQAPAAPNGFVELGLAPELVQAVADLGYTQPTGVQERAIPLAMGAGADAGKFIDLMVSSQTGSGKTAAFLLPVLHTLIGQQAAAQAAARAEYEAAVAEAAARGEPAPKRAKRKDPTNPRHFKAATPGALVLCPTRELAQQVAHDAIELVRHCRGLRVANVVGGIPYQLQIAKLQNADLVVATPGRLLDLQRSMQIKLDQVQFLVVDEADRMLDLGFSDDLAEINELTSQRKQTMMFSATFAPRIQQLAMRVMHDGGASVKKVQIDSPQEKHANIKQVLFWADNAQHKRKMLDHWLRDTSINQAVVFASTQVECDGLANDLQQDGFSAVALHGALSQGLRNRRLMALRNGQVQILVATDVAARGIDVPTITHVFNFGLPMKAEDYTHRIGRTGRAGRDGLAVTFAEFRDRRKIFDIEVYSKQPFKAEVIPGLEPQQRPPQARSEFGGRGRDGGGFRDRRPAGGGRGGFGDRHGRGRDDGRGFAPRDDQRGFAPREDQRGFAPRDDQRGFGPRRDGEGYGRKQGFGEPARGGFGGGRGEGGGRGGDFAPRKPAFAKPGAGGGKPSFAPHDARKRPARPAR